MRYSKPQFNGFTEMTSETRFGKSKMQPCQVNAILSGNFALEILAEVQPVNAGASWSGENKVVVVVVGGGDRVYRQECPGIPEKS